MIFESNTISYAQKAQFDVVGGGIDVQDENLYFQGNLLAYILTDAAFKIEL